MRILAFLFLFLAGLARAGDVPEADVYLLGERHDNAAHHEAQADWLARIEPSAIVFEMMPDGMRAQIGGAAEATQLNWWGRAADAELYAPVLEAAAGVPLYGALVDRAAARAAMQAGVAEAFGEEAARFGLTDPLSAEEQAAREAFQMTAHCDALPEAMLPTMVSLQRLRDAALARAALAAFEETGGPVAVITGNGHARRDWGIAPYLERAAPGLRLFALGQGEDGVPPEGVFDDVADAPKAERGDPCDAFK